MIEVDKNHNYKNWKDIKENVSNTAGSIIDNDREWLNTTKK